MSKKHHKHGVNLSETLGIRSPKITLPSIIILILILLQFGSSNITSLSGFNGVDNGILFIIALFYLGCCNTCDSIF